MATHYILETDSCLVLMLKQTLCGKDHPSPAEFIFTNCKAKCCMGVAHTIFIMCKRGKNNFGWYVKYTNESIGICRIYKYCSFMQIQINSTSPVSVHCVGVDIAATISIGPWCNVEIHIECHLWFSSHIST